MMRILRLSCLFLPLVFATFAQITTFEVASVKRAEPMAGSTGIPPRIDGNEGTIRFASVSLKGVLMRAYQLLDDRVKGPAWMDEERYEIIAKVPQGASKDQIHLMLQNLVAERFRMRSHWEEKQTAGYALVVGKGGSKLKASTEAHGTPSISMSSDGVYKFRKTTLDHFAEQLTPMVGRPVVNRTQISGTYDITIECDPASVADLPAAFRGKEPSSNPPVTSAIRLQLGLNLEQQTLPVKRLIVDAAQKIPTAN